MQIWLRCITAIIGGYAISTGFSISLVPVVNLWMNYTLSVSILITTMLGYVCYFIIIILSFSSPTLKCLWRNLFILCAILLLLNYLPAFYQPASVIKLNENTFNNQQNNL